MESPKLSRASSNSEPDSNLLLLDSIRLPRLPRLFNLPFQGMEQSNPGRCDVCGYDKEECWPLPAQSDFSWPCPIDLSQLIERHKDCKFCDVLYQGITLFRNGEQVLSAIKAVEGTDAPTTLHVKANGDAFDVSYSSWYWTQPPWSLEESNAPPSLLLQFYTDSERKNPIPPDVFADSCWFSMTKWIHECCMTHVSCQINEETLLPMRYLHILHSENTSSSPFVQLCTNETGRRGRFAALSHVWGASKPINTTSDNIALMLQEIAYQTLPKTFQQAISICIKLGLEFLWIDSLCIIQDDDKDWRTQASKMADVYANSYITIAAHPTEDMRGNFDIGADNGCHLNRAAVLVKTAMGADGTPFSIFARKTHKHDQFVAVTVDEGRSSYFKRGWCLQERLLAPRILHFMESEVLFECNQGMECECGEASHYANSGLTLIHAHLKKLLASALHKASSMKQRLDEPSTPMETWKAYNKVIEDYADKYLTKPTDRLPALSSLARLISPFLGRYYAGIWEFDLIRGLLWESNWRRMDKRNACHRHPEGAFVAPSFSWASRQGGVTTRHDLEYDSSKKIYAEVCQIECQPRGNDEFGEVTGGYLTLYVCRIPVKYGGRANDLGWMVTLCGEIETSSCTLDTEEDKKRAEKEEIYCLELERSEVDDENFVSAAAIVVVPYTPVVPFTHVQEAYQRIGFVSYRRQAKELVCSEYTII